MKKDARLNLRIDFTLLNLLKELSSDYKITMSSVVSMIITDSIGKKAGIDSTLKKKFKKHFEKMNRKPLATELYISKNMYSRVMDMAMSNHYITGSINMKAINLIIDSYVAEFECYDNIIKKKIGTDFNMTVKNLRNEDFLTTQSRNVKMLKYLSDKHE